MFAHRILTLFFTYTFLGISIFFVSCSDVRFIRKTTTGGTVAIVGSRSDGMEKVNQMLTDHCQGPYTITEEQEVIVGEESTMTQEVKTKDDTRTKSTTVTRQPVIEYHVTYSCNNTP